MRFSVRSFFLATALVLFPGVVHLSFAQATRTWVSGVGDDANPCSRTAPCKTFAGAISKTAAGGIINALDPAGYGSVNITKAITIDGGNMLAGVLASQTNGVIVNAGANDVVRLVNLDIESPSSAAQAGLNGIRFINGAHLVVERCRIFGFSQYGLDVEPSDALTHTVTVSESDFDSNTLGAILLKPGGTAVVRGTVSHSRLARNGYGVRVMDNATATVINTTVSEGLNHGLEASSTTSAAAVLNVIRSSVSNHLAASVAAVQSSGAQATVRLTGVGIFNNTIGFSSVAGGTIASFHNNYSSGNTTAGAPTVTVPVQ